jgi:RNA polymerase sigma factor (sigma-70 family)
MPQPISKEKWDLWYAKVYGYFYRRINDKYAVEELTLLTLEDFFLTENEIKSEHGYMWRIAKCKFLNYINHKKSENLPLQEYDQEGEDNYDSHYQEKLEQLMRCVKEQLKEQDREIIELSVMADFSSKRVSEELGMSSDNVRQRLSRSLKKLREKCKSVWLDYNS